MPRWLLVLVLLAACAAPVQTPPDPAPAPSELSEDWVGDLRRVSCPEGEDFVRAQPISITAEPVELGEPSRVSSVLTGLTYVGGWALTSDEPNFGGLSGIEIFPSGNLLIVSDAGAFVWIRMKEDAGFEPEGQGSIAYMRGMDGKLLQGKSAADAEGLALKDGLALVSFEREHRVLAFDLEACGAAARGALMHDLKPSLERAGLSIGENMGAEALALASKDQLIIGLEERGRHGAPVAIGTAPDMPLLDIIIPNGPRVMLVGADAIEGDSEGKQTLYSVHRAYDPIRGNLIRIRETAMSWQLQGDPPRNYVPPEIELPHTWEPGNSRTLGHIAPPLTVDNFEGIAAKRLADGTVRLYIISDDNFSNRQRTLLMAFDVVEAAPP